MKRSRNSDTIISLRWDTGHVGLEPAIAVREIPTVNPSNLGKTVVKSVVRMDGLGVSQRRHYGGGGLQSSG